MADHLLTEVDNALKLHRLEQLWHKSGQQIVLLVAVSIISLIAFLIWKEQQFSRLQTNSDALLRLYLAKQNSQDLPELPTLAGAHAQLAGLLEGNIAETPIADGNDLLTQYNCLLRYQQNAQTLCQLNDAFAPLKQEFELLHLLSQGDIMQAKSLLSTAITPRDPLAKRRLDNIRSYIQSSLSAPSPQASPQKADAS